MRPLNGRIDNSSNRAAPSASRLHRPRRTEYWPGLRSRLPRCWPDEACDAPAATVFIFRDPRDVVVSHVFYVTEMESRHVHHAYYQSLPDFDARLKVSILGRPDTDVEFPNIAERFAPYLGWLDQPEVLTIHFEGLIQDRAQTLNRIMDHFLARVPLDTLRLQDERSPSLRSARTRQLILESLESSINPNKSPTFRSGKTGEWRQHFTDEHKKIFKSITGDFLIRLGYETNLDW
jgi:hypothetical protein